MLLALLIAPVVAAASPADACGDACAEPMGLGQQVTVVLPSGHQRTVWAGFRPAELDGTAGMALTQAPGEPGAPTDMAGPQPAVGPWCAVSNLLQRGAGDSSQAAAVQVATWKVLQPGITAADPQLELQAATLAADAWAPCRAIADQAELIVDPAAGLVLAAPAPKVASSR